MPRSKRSVCGRLAGSRTFGSGHAEETCRSRIFHSDQSEKTCRSRIFHSDQSEKTCRSRIFHSDQSEKTCRSRIFPSGRGEETCRSRNFPTSRIPQQTFVLVLDRASTVTTVDSDVSDRGKHRGSLKYAQGGRFCTRVAESVTVGHVVSKPLGSPVGLDDVRDPIHRVKTGRVCEGMPRSKRSGVRPISRWRTFGSGHAEETCRSRIFHSDKSEKTCRSRIFHSDKSEKTCRSRIFHSDQSEKTCRSRIFHSDQSEKTCRSRIFPSAVVKRPADRGTFPPAESLNKLRSRLGPCQHCNDGPFRRFRPRQASRIAQIRSRRSLLHSSRRVRGGRFCTRVAESVTVGHVVSKPLGSPVGLDDVRDPIHRVKTGRVCEGMPRSKRSGVRPIGRWRTFGSGHAEETCRSRIFHSDQSEKTCRSRIFHSDQSEKTCRSRIFHSDQSEKTCRSRIFPSGRGEETCRFEELSHQPNPSTNFRSRLGPCQHCNYGRFRRFRPRKHRGSLKYAQGGRFCTRVAESVTVGHVVSKPLGSPVGLDDVRDPIHRVKTGRVCEGMPRSKRSGVRPIGRWRTFGSGHAEETCRSRIFHSDQSEKTCRSRIFHSDQSEKTCRSRIFHSDKSEKTCRSRIFHSDQSEKTCRSSIFPSGRGEETCRSRNFPTSRIPQQTFVLVLDRARTVTTVDSDVSDRGKHRGSLKYAQGGRFCTRVAESVTVGHVVSKPLGSPVGLAWRRRGRPSPIRRLECKSDRLGLGDSSAKATTLSVFERSAMLAAVGTSESTVVTVLARSKTRTKVC